MLYTTILCRLWYKDSSKEFANSKFIDMIESMNITVKVTMSPFRNSLLESNSLLERHNLIIADMIDKVLEESKHLDMDLTLAWCLNAKNSQANVHGFSTFQLVFGQNPKLPSTSINKPPALIQHDTSEILTDNVTVLQKARQAFIISESSEEIQRASNNIQTSEDTKYITGDSVYFKRIDEKCWSSPGKALGQDGRQVLVKYGSNY